MPAIVMAFLELLPGLNIQIPYSMGLDNNSTATIAIHEGGRSSPAAAAAAAEYIHAPCEEQRSNSNITSLSLHQQRPGLQKRKVTQRSSKRRKDNKSQKRDNTSRPSTESASHQSYTRGLQDRVHAHKWSPRHLLAGALGSQMRILAWIHEGRRSVGLSGRIGLSKSLVSSLAVSVDCQVFYLNGCKLISAWTVSPSREFTCSHQLLVCDSKISRCSQSGHTVTLFFST